MKKILVFTLLVQATFLSGCNNTIQQKNSKYDPFNENPVIITWKGETQEVESYQAVETIYEVYQDIEINNTPEQLFRLLQK